ncbi:glycerophosphodiester phosphodiesterase [Flavobacteriaceae bacterium Ap0902]|nr:glycerophosphodiester phosphodiesterase [Flavobacteriaceae bacterium Ap0902]
MKNISFLFILITAFIFSCKDAPDVSIDHTIADSHQLISALMEDKAAVVSAHRGGSGIKGYPENALETLAYLYGQDIKIFEIDVIQTKDQQVMLLHDDFLERTTTGNGKIKDLTAEDLLKYNLKDDFGRVTEYKIPFLKDVLKWAKNKDAYLMIDFKRNVDYDKVINLVREYGVENQSILISYNVEQAKKLHQLAPEINLSVSARNMQELDWLLKTKIPTTKMIAFTGTRLSKDTLYERLNQLKIPAILGTLGNLDKRAAARGDHLYKDWAVLGIQIIATDRPIDAYNALKETHED